MLTLTDTAIEVVRTITTAEGIADGTGLRISSTADTQAEGLELAVAPEPDQQDQVIANDGARLFLDPKAATYLDDKLLDANVDEGGQVSFSVAPLPPNA